jgi:peptidoglycan biosynthesis protein MviN/MurJ (putative lipid II flippase)
MKKTVLVFGLISGVTSAGMMLVTMPFTEHIGYDRALVVGYTNIVLSFLLVYFGIRSYRRHPDHFDFVRNLCGQLGDCVLRLQACVDGPLLRAHDR